jgi:hypothetical protein
MNRRLLALLTTLALAAAGCNSDKICPSDQRLCGGACVSLQSDPQNCGACGRACGAGQACSSGACVGCGPNGEYCKADVLAACFNANQVPAFSVVTDGNGVASLVPVGTPVNTKAGPISLAALGGAIYVADSIESLVEQVTPQTATAVASVAGGSYNDLEHLGVYGGLLWVSNAAVGSLVAVDPVASKVLDEVSLGDDTPDPLGFDFANHKAYVALSPSLGMSSPNGLAVVDLSVAPPWGAAKPAVKRIDLSGFAHRGASAGVSRVLSAPDEKRVFVTLNDLWDTTTWPYQPVPGANGKLVVVDTATDEVVGIDLGAGCLNPGGMALAGSTLWIGCGYPLFNASYTSVTAVVGGALLPVDVAGATPVPGDPVQVPNGHTIGSVRICGSRGYAGASDSGTLVAFDPSSGAISTVNEGACAATGVTAVYDVECAP